MASDAKVTADDMIEACAVAASIDSGTYGRDSSSARTLVATAAYIRRANAVLGPECPKCGRFMKAEHVQNYTDHHVWAVYRTRWGIGERVTGKPCFSGFELAAQYPEIAKAIGIDVTPAEATESERREG